MHRKHHADNVEASLVHRRRVETDLANDVEILNALTVAILDREASVEDARGRPAMVATTSTTSAATLQVPVAIASLLDGNICGVQSNVKLNGLGRLLPLVQVTTFAAANVKNKKLIATRTAHLSRARSMILVRGVSLDNAALHPVVEDAKASDLAVGSAPLATTFGDAVVVLSHDIVDAATLTITLDSCGIISVPLGLTLSLTTADCFAVCIGKAGSSTRTLQLARLFGRRQGSALHGLKLRCAVGLWKIVVLRVISGWSLVILTRGLGIGRIVVAHDGVWM
jgi:hypothetical protein